MGRREQDDYGNEDQQRKKQGTQTHNHYWVVELSRKASREEVLDAFKAAPRIAFIRMSDGNEKRFFN